MYKENAEELKKSLIYLLKSLNAEEAFFFNCYQHGVKADEIFLNKPDWWISGNFLFDMTEEGGEYWEEIFSIWNQVLSFKKRVE